MVEIAAEPTDLDADDRIVLRVEALVAAEHRQGDVECLQPLPLTVQGPLDEVGEQLAAAGAGLECSRIEQPFEIVADLAGRLWNLVTRLWPRAHLPPRINRRRLYHPPAPL